MSLTLAAWLILTPSISFFSSSALALLQTHPKTEENLPTQPAPPEEDSLGRLQLQGNLRLDHDNNPDANGDLKENLRTQRLELQASLRLMKDLSFHIAKDFRYVLRSKMERNFIVEGRRSTSHLKAADYVKES